MNWDAQSAKFGDLSILYSSSIPIKLETMANRATLSRSKTGAAQDPTQCPAGIDINTFFFPLIPDEVKTMVPVYHSTSIDIVKILLQVVIDYLCSTSLNFPVNSVEVYNNGLKPEETNSILTSLYYIIRTAFRNKVKSSVVKSDLAKMNVPATIIDAMLTSITVNRANYESRIICNRLTYPKLEKLRWRVDVVLSSGSLTRVLRPTILMQMITKDGRMTSFEISIEMFHSLRYNVAKVLHEMQTLERHPIIRIVNEFKRREEEEYNN